MEQHEQTLSSPPPPTSPSQKTTNQDEKETTHDPEMNGFCSPEPSNSSSKTTQVETTATTTATTTSTTDGKQRLRRLLNRNMKITMTDGRTLIGMFLCTDRSCNVILGSCQEYLNYELVEAQQKRQQQLQQKSESPLSSDGSSEDSTSTIESPPIEEPRVLGLAMVPGHHIVSIHVDDPIPDSGEEDEPGAILWWRRFENIAPFDTCVDRRNWDRMWAEGNVIIYDQNMEGDALWYS